FYLYRSTSSASSIQSYLLHTCPGKAFVRGDVVTLQAGVGRDSRTDARPGVGQIRSSMRAARRARSIRCSCGYDVEPSHVTSIRHFIQMATPISFVDLPLLRVAYEVAGPAGGYPIILLHGWPDDVRTWDRVLPALHEAGYRTYAPWLRGYGATRFTDDRTFRCGQLV